MVSIIDVILLYFFKKSKHAFFPDIKTEILMMHWTYVTLT